MKITKSAIEAAQKIDKFISAATRELDIRFPDGFFLRIKKRGNNALEIHTAGYDGTLERAEAISWIKWELIDNIANGILTE